MTSNKKLFFFLAVPLVLVLLTIVGYSVLGKKQTNLVDTSQTSTTNTTESAITKETCSPIQLQSPVDISLVTSILYPGQTRGGHYKAHGGFRFDNNSTNSVIVTAPFDGHLTSASRYIEQGETQYLLEFTTACNVTYRFDHLLTLSDKLQAVIEILPTAKADDSRTTNINPPLSVTAGETIATAVGLVKGPNVAVDFGVYDLRQQNTASQDASWAKQHEAEKSQAWYGVCWFDLLPTQDAESVKNLPAGDSTSGKTSDYCK